MGCLTIIFNPIVSRLCLMMALLLDIPEDWGSSGELFIGFLFLPWTVLVRAFEESHAGESDWFTVVAIAVCVDIISMIIPFVKGGSQ